MIRTLIALALSFGFAACAGSPPPPGSTWKKEGADAAAMGNDTAQCRTLAQQQAARLYPFGTGSPTLGGAGMISAQQAANNDRSSAEREMFNDCMQGKGYSR
jgi:hypothetical protein